MEAGRRLVGLGRAARTDARVRVRQPLRRALLLHPGADLSDPVRREVAEELNVKALEDVESLAGLMSWTVVPNFKALGPRLGPRVNQVKEALTAAAGAELKDALDEQGFIEVAGERLGPDDVEVRAREHEDFALAQEGAWAVAIDLDLDDALRREGTARELVRALNDLRRAVGLALSDRIEVRLDVSAAPRLAAAVEAHRDWIRGEVLAMSLETASFDSDRTQQHAEPQHPVDVDGEPVVVALRVA
jgi:isoleucyl-tRNA synthetase